MDYIALSIPLFFLLMGAELAWSWWSGRKVYRFNDFIANLGCGIGSQVVGAFTKTLIFAAYLYVWDHWRLFTVGNGALAWVGAFLLVDLLYYWFHRASHEVNAFWAAHVVHHQSEEYNLSVALRQSWFQGLISWWFYLPMAWLGFHPLTIVTVGAFNTLYQFWIHTKAIGKLGPLEWIFNTPSHHRVHHGSDPKYIDRNHAGTLIIWDKLFGTFQEEEEEPVYGITKPLASWDPVTANFRTWAELGALAMQARHWGDKVRVFLKPPGWRPAELGGFQGPVQRDRASYHKWDTRAAAGVNGYVAFQFVVAVAVTSFFLFRQGDLGVGRSWAMAGWIIWTVMDLGVLLEGKRWGWWLELARLASLVVLAGMAGDLFPGNTRMAITTALAGVSLVWCLLLLGRHGRAGILSSGGR